MRFNVLNAGQASFPSGWDGYKTVLTYDKQKFIRVPDTSYDAATGARSVLVSAAQLTPSGAAQALKVEGDSWSADGQRLLVFTNTRKVWRTNSRGDYWTLDLRDGGGSVTRVGRPSSEEAVMMYAKLSPCGTRVGWVEHNDIWVQDLESREVTRLTTTGSPGHGGTAPVINVKW